MHPTEGQIDQLTYEYKGNKLQKVMDGSIYNKDGIVRDYRQNPHHSTTHYDYDHNGNMKADSSKFITSIQYNYLNLPQKIRFNSGVELHYYYDASGKKLKMHHSHDSTEYIDGIHYENGKRAFVQHKEGQVDLKNHTYLYYLTDHLGNVRQMMDSSGHIAQSTDYYPFGLVARGGALAQNKYLYNDKEYQDLTGWYDYGARMYDGQIGRWHVVDRQAERNLSMSSYNYVANNPLLFIDPYGEEIWINFMTDNGEKERIKYSIGMEYKGDNLFTSNVVQTLNQMSSVDGGAVVLNDLSSSKNLYNFSNEVAVDKQGKPMKDVLSFSPDKLNGGGVIKAGNIGTISKPLQDIAHELFHGYQYENGQGDFKVNGVNNEVGAYLFGAIVSKQSRPYGVDTKIGQSYYLAMLGLELGGYNKDDYHIAINSFKKDASVNQSGIYNKFGVNQNLKPLITKFLNGGH
ncbi:RHS repeat-associated core domain-containing protein [Persicobacter psychrovividus]|uniref:RHS repeat-associated core domain-containing protein n=1 Tax=Persicobacter psychrovividus TaxID=387638 RepID=A0ABN6LCI8_9BACT|nr:hypothetical protein PEPS_13020 [Persicobacter psychrovividus]